MVFATYKEAIEYIKTLAIVTSVTVVDDGIKVEGVKS